MVVIEMKAEVLRKARKITKLRGTLKVAADTTGVHRTTIARILSVGTGVDDVVYKLEEYFSNVA